MKNKKLFSEISAFVTGDLDPGLFIISGKLINGTGKTEAEEAIKDELDILKNELVSNVELQKVKNKIEANLIFSRMSILNKAMHLSYFELLGDAMLWHDEAGCYNKVSSRHILETSRQIFRETQQNTLFYKASPNH